MYVQNCSINHDKQRFSREALNRDTGSMYIKGFLLLNLIFILFSGCVTHSQKAGGGLKNAVLNADTESAEHSLELGADVNLKDQNRGWTPLLFATEAGDTKMVALLLKYGADPNLVSNKNRISALHRAASHGYLKIAERLVEKGADINYQDGQLKSTPLMWAAVNNHRRMVQYLLENNALVNVRGNRGESALLLAVSGRSYDVVKLLLAYGAVKDRPDIYGVTPLQKAIRLKDENIIELLKEK